MENLIRLFGATKVAGALTHDVPRLSVTITGTTSEARDFERISAIKKQICSTADIEVLQTLYRQYLNIAYKYVSLSEAICMIRNTGCGYAIMEPDPLNILKDIFEADLVELLNRPIVNETEMEAAVTKSGTESFERIVEAQNEVNKELPPKKVEPDLLSIFRNMTEADLAKLLNQPAANEAETEAAVTESGTESFEQAETQNEVVNKEVAPKKGKRVPGQVAPAQLPDSSKQRKPKMQTQTEGVPFEQIPQVIRALIKPIGDLRNFKFINNEFETKDKMALTMLASHPQLKAKLAEKGVDMDAVIFKQLRYNPTKDYNTKFSVMYDGKRVVDVLYNTLFTEAEGCYRNNICVMED